MSEHYGVDYRGLVGRQISTTAHTRDKYMRPVFQIISDRSDSFLVLNRPKRIQTGTNVNGSEFFFMKTKNLLNIGKCCGLRTKNIVTHNLTGNKVQNIGNNLALVSPAPMVTTGL